jgi:hypothetical protein
MAFNAMKFIVVFIVWVLCLSVEVAPRGVVAQTAVLHKNGGELVFSEEMPPGAAIPRHLMAVWNEPGFEEMLRCGSVPTGQRAEPLSRNGVRDCYHHGDAELR